MDKEAEHIFLQTLEKEKDRIFRICHSYSHNSEDARDLFQEVVYNFWKSLPSFQGKSSISTWLYRIAVNVCLKQKARRRIETLRHVEVENFEEKVQANPQLEALYLAIKRLEKVDRALVMLYLEELPYKEIAQITGISENHVAVKMKRIRAKLSTHIKAYL
ncbi:MAG: RNA polymerase sigma factor [Bacteroidota bacterium]